MPPQGLPGDVLWPGCTQGGQAGKATGSGLKIFSPVHFSCLNVLISLTQAVCLRRGFGRLVLLFGTCSVPNRKAGSSPSQRGTAQSPALGDLLQTDTKAAKVTPCTWSFTTGTAQMAKTASHIHGIILS